MAQAYSEAFTIAGWMLSKAGVVVVQGNSNQIPLEQSWAVDKFEKELVTVIGRRVLGRQ
jgi:hypothetical protein